MFDENNFPFPKSLPPESSQADHNPIPRSPVNFDDIEPAFGEFGETIQHEVERHLELGLPDGHTSSLSHDRGSKDLGRDAHSAGEPSFSQAHTSKGSLENCN